MTGKQFVIDKLPLNRETLQEMTDKMPKIIHVCCSGAFEDGEFCMKLEAGNGMEEKIKAKTTTLETLEAMKATLKALKANLTAKATRKTTLAPHGWFQATKSASQMKSH